MSRYRVIGGPNEGQEYEWAALPGMTEMTLNGQLYLAHPEMTQEFSSGQMRFTVRGHQTPRNRCDCCGRADWIETVCCSIEECVEQNWLIPVVAA